VTWATSVPILVFLGLSVLDLGPMYATDRQTDVRRASSLNASYSRGGGIIALGMGLCAHSTCRSTMPARELSNSEEAMGNGHLTLQI